MEEPRKSGSVWEGATSITCLVVAILLGIPAVGSYRFLHFVPFIGIVAIGFGAMGTTMSQQCMMVSTGSNGQSISMT
jgi:hypothetical protein